VAEAASGVTSSAEIDGSVAAVAGWSVIVCPFS
jgi:hypothetical protein